MVCAVFINSDYAYILTGLLLFLPIIDDRSLYSEPVYLKKNLLLYLLIFLIALALIFSYQITIKTSLAVLLLIAIPEEWFFRKYVLNRINELIKNRAIINTEWLSNILTSLIFSIFHTIHQGIEGLLVFIPSLVLGWIYMRYHDILLTSLVHFLFNLSFISILAKYV